MNDAELKEKGLFMSISKCKCGSPTIIVKPSDTDKEIYKKLKSRIIDLTGSKDISIKPRKHRCQDIKCKNSPVITLEMPTEIIDKLLDTIVDQNNAYSDLLDNQNGQKNDVSAASVLLLNKAISLLKTANEQLKDKEDIEENIEEIEKLIETIDIIDNDDSDRWS